MRTFRNMTLSTLLALLLFSCACYAQTGEETMLAKARTHFNNGKYYFATTWLGRILKNYPASPHRKEVLLLIAKAYTMSGREEKAVPYLHELLHDFPETAAKLDPELLELAQSGEPARPAAIVTPSPPQSPPAKKPTAPATARKAPAVLAAPALPIAEPALRPTEPVSTPTAAPAPAGTAEKATGGSAAAKRAETAKTITPPPQKQEQSPPPAKPSPPATAAGQPPAAVSATAAAAPTQPPAKTTTQPPAATTVLPPAAVTLPTPGAATAQPRSGGGEQVYYVLAGETINHNKIEPLLKKLKGAGLQPIIREETESREIYRLVADCYDDRNSAEKRLSLIPRMSRNPFLIRNENSFCIIIGSFSSEKAALQEQTRLAGKGQKMKIAKFQVPLAVWQVIVGRFTHAQDAEKVVKTLAARGVAATVIKPWD